MNSANPEIRRTGSSINRRTALFTLGAVTGGLLLPETTLVEACAPAIIVKNNDSKVATANLIGQRVIEELMNDQMVNSWVEGPSDKVDLRLSLDQDREATRRYGTFKTDRDILEQNWATLIGGDLYTKPGGIFGLHLYGKDIQWKGNWGFDTEGLVERCGVEDWEGAWKVVIERAVLQGSNVNYKEEFSFPVVPDCGPKRQQYISTVRRVIAQPQSTPTPRTEVVSTPTPNVPSETPTQRPIPETGVPGISPAQRAIN